ncbi:MAG: protein translocase subunit SecF [Nitrospirae bacterium CG_4_9_14_3_um_filter_53_35]|nr:MAG: protein-export membrane protein SecF [Nitrospirae bacterium CG2_30_53_67]PIS36015.1 MAG: protein translocase subunit SecF [Nitrospirae bacterium CG08_land_8_20_14_0_20_52_24]PIV84780.1 MAG: protein translocase subunit SecF [Nitrospirae bacterium CG17_big_fil_post_rev_8_21_14_2_50_50_9]PIW84640.1 MAG: protein translocase subunit SecF [Nitrospirae bacterium CG_4_8_14_3_um_filter_50_41]PIX86268.1 MAG: protein translocase subunit SecF [Nitrospirae bacterium CG_4_10_14_3_um_filter_53_41]PJA
MEIIKPDININFVKKMWIGVVASWTMILIGIGSIMWHGGLNYGIDFKGGTLVELKFNAPADISKIRQSLKEINLGDSVIQEYGSPDEIMIRLEKSSEGKGSVADLVTESLQKSYGKDAFAVQRVEEVGPQVGRDLQLKALKALAFSLVALLIYITFRFEFRFALGATLATIHDVLITIGVFSLLNKEFNLPIIAALLTIVGYSLNDTIVVCDRIRERMKLKKKETFDETINQSINQTLSRTILTSLTVFIVVVILFFLGGEVIHDFAFAMIVGVVVGTYSSIFVATPVVVFLDRFVKPAKAKA